MSSISRDMEEVQNVLDKVAMGVRYQMNEPPVNRFTAVALTGRIWRKKFRVPKDVTITVVHPEMNI